MTTTDVENHDSNEPSSERTEGVSIDARVFGGFRVAVNARPIDERDWGRAAAERLFKLLLISHGHRIHRDVAAEALWPEMDPAHQGANMRKALHFARRALERHGRVLVSGRHEIGLTSTVDLRLDLDQFISAYERIARAGGPTSTGAVSEEDVLLVLRLGALELLPDDRYEEWLATLREMIRLRWLTFSVEAARARMSDGRIAEAREILNSVLARDPADEDAHLLLSELLAGQGHHYAARRQLAFARRRLAEALGDDAGREKNGLALAY